MILYWLPEKRRELLNKTSLRSIEIKCRTSGEPMPAMEPAWRVRTRKAGFGWRFDDGVGAAKNHFANRRDVSSALMGKTLAVKTAFSKHCS